MEADTTGRNGERKRKWPLPSSVFSVSCERKLPLLSLSRVTEHATCNQAKMKEFSYEGREKQTFKDITLPDGEER